MQVRVGLGVDLHPWSDDPDRRLRLGGVTFPDGPGLAGHSDADAVAHACADALLGAAGLGDIGRHFPDTDAAYENVDSRVLLRRVQAMLGERGWEVVNVDAIVVAQAPRLAPYVPAMAANIAADLQVASERVNIKATTTEHLGFVGREEGIAAQAVVLIAKK